MFGNHNTLAKMGKSHEETLPLPVDRDRCDRRTCVWSHIVDSLVSQDCFLFSTWDRLFHGNTHDRFWWVPPWTSRQEKHTRVRPFRSAESIPPLWLFLNKRKEAE